MRKMMMILMVLIVSMTTTLFADSYVAFTSEEAAALYESDEAQRAVINASVKQRFEYWATLDGLSKQERKNLVQIVVVSETDMIAEVLVYTEDSKVFGISIVDNDGNPIGDYHYEASSKTDQVLVGLNFVKEIVFQVNNIDKGKVVYSSFAVEPVVEEQ